MKDWFNEKAVRAMEIERSNDVDMLMKPSLILVENVETMEKKEIDEITKKVAYEKIAKSKIMGDKEEKELILTITGSTLIAQKDLYIRVKEDIR